MRCKIISGLAWLLGVTIYIDGVRHGAKITEGPKDSMR